MVKMGVRDQNMADALIGFQCFQNCLDMFVQQWPRINDGDITVADYISASAGESEGARIIRNDAANTRRQPVRNAIFEFNIRMEVQHPKISTGLLAH